MNVYIHIIHSYTHVHPRQYHYTFATSIEWYHHFWPWRFQILPQTGTEMPVPNFACKPFLQCYDTFTAGCLHIWAPLCVSTIQALSVSRLISTDINRSHSEHTETLVTSPGAHQEGTQTALSLSPCHLHRQEASALDVALSSPISVKILSFPFPLLLVAAGSRHGETKNLCQIPSLNWIQGLP